MASSIGDAAVNLDALLTAATWPGNKPQITFGPPDAYEEPEVVALVAVEEPDEAAAALGPAAKREETYVLVVRAKAHDATALTGRDVFLRAWVLREVVRATVVANSTLTGAVRESDVIGGGPSGVPFGLVVPAEGGGWVAFTDCRIQCRARIA